MIQPSGAVYYPTLFHNDIYPGSIPARGRWHVFRAFRSISALMLDLAAAKAAAEVGAGLGRRGSRAPVMASPQHTRDSSFLLKLECRPTWGEFGLVAAIAGASPEKMVRSNCRACRNPPPNHPYIAPHKPT